MAEWALDIVNVPSKVWLPGLCRPATLLTAVLQTAARKHEWPLDQVKAGLGGVKSGLGGVKAGLGGVKAGLGG
eukprot:4313927-Pyramimonas_sp.AAC.2